jgi:hypothetical protein
VDSAASSVAFAGPPPDSRTLSGSLTLELGAVPPLAATTTFDLRAADRPPVRSAAWFPSSEAAITVPSPEVPRWVP